MLVSVLVLSSASREYSIRGSYTQCVGVLLFHASSDTPFSISRQAHSMNAIQKPLPAVLKTLREEEKKHSNPKHIDDVILRFVRQWMNKQH